MIARVAKNIYNEQISKQILTAKQNRQEQQVDMWTIEFLNILLGSSADTDEFWKILVKQTARYFKYPETELRDIRPNALYFAFLDLTNLTETGL